MWPFGSSVGSDPRRPRIFQIGFNRCGTKSLCSFFDRNGFRAVHWHRGRLAEGIELARLERKPLLTYVGRWTVYTDMERVAHRRLFKGRILRKLLRLKGQERLHRPIYAFRYFRTLDRQYPGSKFILNVRDVEGWVRSRLRFVADDGGDYRFCRCGDRAHRSTDDLVTCWKEHWREHTSGVRDHFRERDDDFLEFDIEEDPPEKLETFMERAGHDVDPGQWPWRNRTGPAADGGAGGGGQ